MMRFQLCCRLAFAISMVPFFLGCQPGNAVVRAGAPVEDVACEVCDTFPEDVMDGAPYRLDIDQKEMVRAQNGFGIDLYKTMLDSENGDANICLSPLSMAMNIEMLLNGASDSVRREALAAIGSGMEEVSQPGLNQFNRQLYKRLVSLDSLVDVSIANSVWADEDVTLMRGFVREAREYYFASVRSCDLSSRHGVDEINSWVSRKTKGLIPKIVDNPFGGDVDMVMVNTLYFNGAWETPFDERWTKKRVFHCADGKDVEVDMMDGGGSFPVGYPREESCFTMVALRFGAGDYEMRFILPDEGRTLKECARCLTSTYLRSIERKGFYTNYNLFVPRFEVKFRKSYKNVLEGLGMGCLFDRRGGLDGLAEGVSHSIGDIFQESKVIVREANVEAAAATWDMLVGSTGVSRRPEPLVLDRPFMFMIVERGSGAILFIGDVKCP